jgi:hypothetical protein
MTDTRLFLVSANKSHPGNLEWSADDYDIRHGAPDGRLVGRIYKHSHAPTGKWWFWAVQIFPAVASDSGAAESREAAMAALKAQWLLRREAWAAWVGPT